jgi:hypothetical protein
VSFFIESLFFGSYRISDHKNENIQRHSLKTTRVSKYGAQKEFMWCFHLKKQILLMWEISQQIDTVLENKSKNTNEKLN